MLTTKKDKKTYIEILAKLKEAQPLLNPKHIMVDFELAAINAVADIFPEATVHGCFFHFSQAVWRNIQKHKLSNAYSSDPDIALALRSLLALAFVPPKQVKKFFVRLIKTPIFILPEMEPIVQYFQSTWIGDVSQEERELKEEAQIEIQNTKSQSQTQTQNETDDDFFEETPTIMQQSQPVNVTENVGKKRKAYSQQIEEPASKVPKQQRKLVSFDLKLWNMYKLTKKKSPRTNNATEGWHSAMARFIGSSHPNIFVFIENIKQHQHLQEKTMLSLLAQQEIVQAKRYRNQDERLIKLVEFYSKNKEKITWQEYLSSIANVLQFSV